MLKDDGSLKVYFKVISLVSFFISLYFTFFFEKLKECFKNKKKLVINIQEMQELSLIEDGKLGLNDSIKKYESKGRLR